MAALRKAGRCGSASRHSPRREAAYRKVAGTACVAAHWNRAAAGLPM